MIKPVSKDLVNAILWETAEQLAEIRYDFFTDEDVEKIFNILDTLELDIALGNPDYSYN
jgi:uncharacterized Fe-S cluster-containing MiaB family protein